MALGEQEQEQEQKQEQEQEQEQEQGFFFFSLTQQDIFKSNLNYIFRTLTSQQEEVLFSGALGFGLGFAAAALLNKAQGSPCG